MIKEIKRRRIENILNKRIHQMIACESSDRIRYKIGNQTVARYDICDSYLVIKYDRFIVQCGISDDEEIKSLLSFLLYNYFAIKDRNLFIRII